MLIRKRVERCIIFVIFGEFSMLLNTKYRKMPNKRVRRSENERGGPNNLQGGSKIPPKQHDFTKIRVFELENIKKNQ